MSSAKRSFTMSDFVCNECKNKISLPRLRQREKFHIKTFYCPYCKKITDHTEIRYFESECELTYALNSQGNSICYIGNDKETFKGILKNTNRDVFVLTNNNKVSRCCDSKRIEVDNYIYCRSYKDEDIKDYLINNDILYLFIDEDINVETGCVIYKRQENGFINLQTKQFYEGYDFIRRL